MTLCTWLSLCWVDKFECMNITELPSLSTQTSNDIHLRKTQHAMITQMRK